MLKPLIPRKLAVGPKPSLSTLKNEEITAIIDLNQDREEANEASRIGLTYVVDSNLEILDNYVDIPVEKLRYLTTKIHQLVSGGHYVYLHCTASKGRSPTVAVAYLICLGKGKDEAMEMVRSVRPLAWLGYDKEYAASLDKFEKKYQGYCKGK